MAFGDLVAEPSGREFESRQAELSAAGLQLELDPVIRRGQGRNYSSYIEATLRHQDGDVHDVIFFYVAEAGRLVVNPTTATSWIIETIEGSLAEALEGEERSSSA